MDWASVRYLDHGCAELVGSSRPRQTTKTLVVSWRDRLEIIMPKPGSGALDSLSTVERAGILTALLQAHPELLAEAELLAAVSCPRRIAMPWPRTSLTSCAPST
jgi:hypothetical protein